MTLAMVEDLFAKMRADGSMDVDGELLWGYFFTDPDKAKLRPAAQELERLGYRFVSLYVTADKGTHFLHVERIERHTPQSLHEANQAFQALAERHGLQAYDGMDVGPVEAEG